MIQKVENNFNSKIFKQELVGIIILALIELLLIYLGYYLSFSVNKFSENNILKNWWYIVLLVFFSVVFINYIKRKIIVDDYSITHQSLFKTESMLFSEVYNVPQN